MIISPSSVRAQARIPSVLGWSKRLYTCQGGLDNDAAMVRWSVPLVVTALALAFAGPVYGELAQPVLRVGETLRLPQGDVMPGETAVCVDESARITLQLTIPSHMASAVMERGKTWGIAHRDDGLSLSILVTSRGPFVLTCNLATTPVLPDGWGKAVPNPDYTVPICEVGVISTTALPCTTPL